MAANLSRTSLALTVALAMGGFAAAQGLTGDAAQPVVSYQDLNDMQSVSVALSAARSGDGSRVQSILATTTDPLARKVALWALADAAPDTMTWAQAEQARQELADWPRPSHRQMAAEKLIGQSGMAPKAVIAWFGTAPPITAQGAMSLAGALRADGQTSAAAAVIRHAWRSMPFDESVEAAMLTQFPDMLTPADMWARTDYLLYGTHDAAALDLIARLPPDRQAVAQARIALRRGDPNAEALVAALPPADQTSPGVIYERLLAYQARGDVADALNLVAYMPESLPYEGAAEKLWHHGSLVVQALQMGDPARAYAAADHSGLNSGVAAGEAQFYAGWIALTRLKNPKLADQHFAMLETLSESPITQSRALYWRGRAADAEGDGVAAQLFYAQGARYQTTFYGQLAAARAGTTEIVLGHDPQITSAERADFEARDAIKAARLLARMGNKDGFHAFVVGLSETLPSAAEEAQLVDLAQAEGEQSLAMRVVRNAAKRGFILPDRGYPVRMPPSGAFAVETPLVLGITRQESSFDPEARSGAGARGMMQLMPATAEGVARRNGLGWGRLDDPDFNMRVGSAYLGQLVSQFSGSYVLAAAAYNAGPGRPAQWTSLCGDPRSGGSDPLDFIECIPFSETRDYVMRVLEATEIYRAKLAGGHAPLILTSDLRRGAYGYQVVGPTVGPTTLPVAVQPAANIVSQASPGGH
ncbi:MAG: lytic transglycosylase domain-containing protein [Caulobacteraceae bacterium]|nr:lytic transglycosylase domain-containing protein [Caulobacteraceae bacterium]